MELVLVLRVVGVEEVLIGLPTIEMQPGWERLVVVTTVSGDGVAGLFAVCSLGVFLRSLVVGCSIARGLLTDKGTFHWIMLNESDEFWELNLNGDCIVKVSICALDGVAKVISQSVWIVEKGVAKSWRGTPYSCYLDEEFALGPFHKPSKLGNEVLVAVGSGLELMVVLAEELVGFIITNGCYW